MSKAVGLSYVEATPGGVVDRRYRVKREIARGGMGVVHEADHEVVRRPVALKTLTGAALETPLLHARLIREARALSMITHPHVVAVHDAGCCEVHGTYVALEMLEGRSLEGFVVARRQLELDTVLEVTRQIGGALAAVHAQQIVHRDVKPGNVLVALGADRRTEVLKLIDFGIATVPGQADVVDRKLTHDGEILGTVEYMAPEQLLDGAPPSFASDVYALGVTLYECLAGDVPHPGRAPAVMAALAAGKRFKPIREVRPDVPPWLASAIERALSVERGQRFPDALAFVAACTPSIASAPPSSIGLIEVEAEEPSTRRQYVRAPYVTPVRILTAAGSADGRTEDVSEGGLLVVTTAAVQEGERVSVRFPLPRSGRVVTVEATARWTRTRRGQKAVGVAFAALPDPVREELRAYVGLMAAVPAVVVGETQDEAA